MLIRQRCYYPKKHQPIFEIRLSFPEKNVNWPRFPLQNRIYFGQRFLRRSCESHSPKIQRKKSYKNNKKVKNIRKTKFDKANDARNKYIDAKWSPKFNQSLWDARGWRTLLHHLGADARRRTLRQNIEDEDIFRTISCDHGQTDVAGVELYAPKEYCTQGHKAGKYFARRKFWPQNNRLWVCTMF